MPSTTHLILRSAPRVRSRRTLERDAALNRAVPADAGYPPVAAPAIFAADHPANPKAIAVAVLRIIRHPGSGSAHPRGAVLAMGNFDGLRSEERRVGKEWRSWKWGG